MQKSFLAPEGAPYLRRSSKYLNSKPEPEVGLSFDSGANYQLSTRAKKTPRVQISLLITAAGNKRRRWEQLMVDCFPISVSVGRRPVNLVTTPTELNFKGIIGDFIGHLVPRRSTAPAYISYTYDTYSIYFIYFQIADSFMFYPKL